MQETTVLATVVEEAEFLLDLPAL